MKKTVNINLAGIHFHIDEDAFQKLSSYFDSIRKSLNNVDGSQEIMDDIEARIAELFSEKIDSGKQVVTLREVEEIISIMGEPEAYEMDEEEFEEKSTHTTSSGNATKKLFRDIDNKYIGGVSSGLGHYLGVDAIWIRLIWILLVLAGMGSPVLVYIILWILVPAAITTSDKLKMTGDPINISNIEKKFKEGFTNVTDTVKNADYAKYGEKFKSGTGKFFDGLAKVFKALFIVLVKFVGILLILSSIAIFVSLIAGLFFVGNVYFMDQIMVSNYFIYNDQYPYWVFVLLIFFAIGIPLFAMFVGGLRLLVNHLKSISIAVKIILFVFWLVSIFGLFYLARAQYQEKAFSGKSIEEKVLDISSADTLNLSVLANNQYEVDANRKTGMKIKVNSQGNPVFYSNDIWVNIRKSDDSLAKLIIDKKALGNSFTNAKNRAEMIEYGYEFKDNTLLLDGFFTTDISHKSRNQEMEVTLFLPDETVLKVDPKINSYISPSSKFEGKTKRKPHYYKIKDGKINCLSCPEPENNIETHDSIQINEKEDWEVRVNDNFRENN